MSRNKDEIVAVMRNTDLRTKFFEPESSQRRKGDGPVSDTVVMVPGGQIGLTAEQMATMGKPPRGVVIERADRDKHGDNVKKMGG